MKATTDRDKILFSVSIGIGLIIGNNILGYVYPPFSIICTVFLLPFIIGAVNHPLYKINFLFATAYGFFLLLLNDVLMRMYAGGNYDSVGKLILRLLFEVSGFFCFLIMLGQGIANREAKPVIQILGILVVVSVIVYVVYVSYNMMIER